VNLIALTLILILSVGTAAGQAWPFQQYPATVLHAVPARPQLETPLAKQHATIIRKGAKQGVNFAGRYRVIDWGCGSSCGVYIIVDVRTGRVFEPPEISRGVDLGIAGPEFRPDSTLMVVASCPMPEVYGVKNCERKFYRWDGFRLVLLKSEPVTAPDKTRLNR
jgi:hypothetical protein